MQVEDVGKGVGVVRRISIERAGTTTLIIELSVRRRFKHRITTHSFSIMICDKNIGLV